MFAASDPEFNGWLAPQWAAFQEWDKGLSKLLVFYPTGTGKTKIALAMMGVRDEPTVLVIAPPATHAKWISEGAILGIEIVAISHNKFRQAGYKLSRTMPVIVDEFHLLGGHTGVGWRKIDRLAKGMLAPLILESATPNYNDAERCYCLAHVLHPLENRGGYLSWLYDHCKTAPNPYGAEPIVLGFLEYPDAKSFLAAQPGVVYLEDTAPDILSDFDVSDEVEIAEEFSEYGYDRARNRLIASDMERRQRLRYLSAVDPATGQLREGVSERLSILLGDYSGPVMIFCAHKKIAEKLQEAFATAGLEYAYVDGDTSKPLKEAQLELFKSGVVEYLIGTASIATGVDGLDKVCDMMVIFDDTDDDSLRRQLVGRILPRGIVGPNAYANKVAYRFVYGD